MEMNVGNVTNGTHSNLNKFLMPWWQQLVFITVFVGMFLVATGGNFIVIWIVMAHKRMRTVTNYFLVNLAVADALISLLNTLFTSTYLMYQDWWYGDAYCRFTNFISVCTISASVLTFMAIAIDRYLAIIHPLRPRLTKRVILAICIIWTVSTIVSFPNLIFAHTVHLNESNNTWCFVEWPDGLQGTTEIAYSMLLTAVNYILPLVTLTVTYIQIGVELWGSRAIGEDTPVQLERVKSKRKVVKMMIVVVIIFAICWLPYHLYFIIAAMTDISTYDYIQQIYLVIYWLAMSNSMYNPIIYCWMNSRFRHGFIQAFCCCPCKRCKRIKNRTKQGRPLFPDTNHTYAMTHTHDRNGSMNHTMTEMLENSSSSPNMNRKFIRKHNDFV